MVPRRILEINIPETKQILVLVKQFNLQNIQNKSPHTYATLVHK